MHENVGDNLIYLALLDFSSVLTDTVGGGSEVTPAILSHDLTLSHNKIASVVWRVAQLLNSRATPFRLEQRSTLCNFVAKMR